MRGLSGWRSPALCWLAAALGPALACDGPPSEPVWDPTCDRRGPMSGLFVDITAESGFLFVNSSPDFRGGPIAVADLTGDGFLDLIAGARLGGLQVFAHVDGLEFSDITQAAGLPVDLAVTALATGDLDNDGDADLAIAYRAERSGIALYQNLGAGLFDHVIDLGETGAVEHILFVDIDDDGLLDLHTSNYGAFGNAATANHLLVQRAPWSFVDVPFVGKSALATSWVATAHDFDDDGDPDLYVANDTLAADFGFQVTSVEPGRARDAWLVNQGLDSDGVPVFDERAAQVGLDQPRSSMGGLVADFDGDGLLDLFVPNFGANKLFIADGQGGYVDRAAELGLAVSHRGDLGCEPTSDEVRCLLLSWGSAYADFDKDGWRDLLVFNGPTRFSDPAPPILYFHRAGPASYTEYSLLAGCAEGHGLVPADLDRDGDLDLVVSVREGLYRVYENRSPSAGHWLAIHLIGTASNRDGRGALVRATLANGRQIAEVVGQGGVAFSSAPAEVFVSGGQSPIETVDVTWPSGTVSSHPVLAGQTAIELLEP